MESNTLSMKKKFRWKNKWVTESVYRQRLKQSTNAQKRKSNSCLNNDTPKKSKLQDNNYSESNNLLVGKRLFDLALLAKHMICKCGTFLSFQYIEKETRTGLSSVFHIRCHDCLLINSVPTDTEIKTDTGKTLYETNARMVLGLYDAGLGCTHLNKILGSLNMPSFNSHLFQMYESEVGAAAETVAKKSCEEAVLIERNLTLQNLESIQAMLPDGLEENFLLPDSLINNPSEKLFSPSLADPNKPIHETQTSSPQPDQYPVSLIDRFNVQAADRVRIMVSYDMGWSKRGSGRNYDSNNGYGGLIGVLSGRVLEYGTKNRKCRRCDLGHDKDSHDCRLNYYGSSKGMEANLAVDLIVHNHTLKNACVEVGVIVGDDDSSTISAVRLAANRTIVKFSDMNHTNKGVKKKLYNIQKDHKELTKNAIEYLQRCFSYAVVQNKGNKLNMAKSIRQIPDHAFNKHEKCGQWCGYLKDKENYQHKVINEGFIDKSLHEALLKIFNQLADNVDKFANATSSQLNENLNAIMTSKAPKSRCYNLSSSSDYRFAMAVASKNLGSNYINEILRFMHLSCCPYTQRFMELKQRYAERRKNIINTPAFKCRRNLLKKYRTILRKKKETKEGTTYESAMGLLDVSAVNLNDEKNDEDNNNNNNNNINSQKLDLQDVVFFDIETSSFSTTTEILQIAAKYKNNLFEIYITPTKSISVAASNVNHLTTINGELFYRGKKVPSKSIQSALQDFYSFLKSTGKLCVLVAHNCTFDQARLLYALKNTNMLNLFSQVVSGFTDTLPIFKHKLNRKNNCSQTFLAQELLGISDDEAHNAVQDVSILKSLVEHLNITNEYLIEKQTSLNSILRKELQDIEVKKIMKTLTPLENVISSDIIKKIAKESISYNNLVDSFLENGRQGLIILLSTKIDNKVRVTQNNRILDSLEKFFSDILFE